MPKLIINENAMRLVSAKLEGCPVYTGPDGRFLNPGVIDLAGDGGEGGWFPGSLRAQLLVLADDACRDLIPQIEEFVREQPKRNRIAKQMTVVICKLMDVVSNWLAADRGLDAREVRETWPRTDQETYRIVTRRFRKHRTSGPVRRVRNKLGAHLDLDAIGDAGLRLGPDDLLGAIGDALVLLGLGLKAPSHWFVWIRGLGKSQDGQRRFVETLFEYPISIRWVTDLDGNVLDVDRAHLASDPRHDVRERLVLALEAYNTMADAIGSRMPRIWTRDSEQLRDAEARGG